MTAGWIPERPPRGGRSSRGAAVRFTALFLLASLGLLALLGGPLAGTLRPGLCRLVALHTHWALRLLGEGTTLTGTTVSSPQCAFRVVYACTSLPATILLVSAVLAFPASLGRKLLGAGGGVAALYLLNLVRLVVLYEVQLRWPSLYERMHLTVWQAILVVAAVAFFLAWVRLASGPGASAGGGGGRER